MPAIAGKMFPMATTRLQRRLQQALKDKSVQQAADEWGVPYWVVRDTAKGSTDCPRALFIPGMAKGLGISTDEFIAEAYEQLEPVAVGS